MNEVDFSDLFVNQLTNRYYSQKELMYSAVPGYYLSPFDLKQYYDYLDGFIISSDLVLDLSLKSFNSKHIYYTLCSDVLSYNEEYISLLQESLVSHKPLIDNSLMALVYRSRIYSEIEGSLNVENVPTTRKRLKELVEKNKQPETLNDVIIQNMASGMTFIASRPKFNKENLLKLYNILSNGCLKENDKIKHGNYYRDDDVEIDNYFGCPHQRVDECMDSLFTYVEATVKKGRSIEKLFLPHICHYYIIYVHPYFDYNGRTARMVSLWINLLVNNNMLPPLISEAINQDKNEYYRAIRESRDARNDITYFLKYILKTTVHYVLCYKDLENINQFVKNQNIVLTETELNYVKKILITYKGKFTYLDFIKNSQIEISKQGAFKILNKFVDLDILKSTNLESKVKLFDLNFKIVNFVKRNK